MSDLTAVVTGASRSIGAAVARDFAAAGGSLLIASRRIEAVDRVAEEIREEGGDVKTQQVDVREASEVERLMTTAADIFGTIDVVVANAGIYRGKSGHTPLPEESYGAYDEHLKTNAVGCS